MSSRDFTVRFGLALWVVAVAGAISCSAQTVTIYSQPIVDRLDSRGTLLFGSRQQSDDPGPYGIDARTVGRSHASRGALTLEHPRIHRGSFDCVNSRTVFPNVSKELEFQPASVRHDDSRTVTSNFPTRQ